MIERGYGTGFAKNNSPKDIWPNDTLPNGYFTDGHFVERILRNIDSSIMEYIQTSRGHRKLLYDGYVYVLEKNLSFCW